MKPRVAAAGLAPLRKRFKTEFPTLVAILGDEDIVRFLLCEHPLTKAPPLSEDEADSDDRHIVEWVWGWFVGAAEALGMSRAELYRQLRP